MKDSKTIAEQSLNDNELENIHISDKDLAKEDSLTKEEKKIAKKRAKKLRTPDEIKSSKRKRLIVTIAAITMIVIGIFVTPATRWFILNNLGFRGNLHILVQEKSSNQTISGASIFVDDINSGTTNSSGQLLVSQSKLGNHKIRIEKNGFTRGQINTIIRFGDNKLNTSIEAIGVKVVIGVKNWLNSLPIVGAEVKAGEIEGKTNEQGLATLVIPPTDSKTKISISANDYITKNIELKAEVLSREITLISSAKNYFISKRDGTLHIYSSNIDGTDQKKLIEGTGKENSDFLQFEIHKSNKKAVLVATRDGKKQGDRILTGIYSVDLEKATLSKIDEGSDVQLLGWAGDVMVYSKTDPALNYDNENLTKLQKYNIITNTLTQQAQANYFQAALVAGTAVVYVPADAYRSIPNAELISVDVNSGVRRTFIKDEQVNYINQTGFGIVQLETIGGRRYQINISSGVVQQIDRQPAESRQFALNADGSQYIYTQKLDGKGVLVAGSMKDFKERTIVSLGGLDSPVRWVNFDLVVMRVVTNQETADYVIDLQSGKFNKIVDVFNAGFGRY